MWNLVGGDEGFDLMRNLSKPELRRSSVVFLRVLLVLAVVFFNIEAVLCLMARIRSLSSGRAILGFVRFSVSLGGAVEEG